MGPRRLTRRAVAYVAAAAALAFLGCKREERRFRELPPAATALSNVVMSPLTPGAGVVTAGTRHPYEGNAWAVAQGKRLFNWMNCVGCHANGGGGIGPPLMDDEWIYGSDPANIFSTIVEGRPNGMPSFRGKLTNDQIWQLVAYVRSMSGQVPKDVAPGRPDGMSTKKPEQSTEKMAPKATGGVPKSAEMPQ